MKRKTLALIYLLLLTSCRETPKNYISLSGEWNFSMDTADIGVKEEWFNKTFSETVLLPGSMATNEKGFKVNVKTEWTGSMWNRSWYEDEFYAKYRDEDNTKVVFWLQPDKYYKGPAWYQRKINIPTDAKDQEIVLSLERCHWETSVWIDGKYYGAENSLSVPHRYQLSGIAPGDHVLTIRVDNRINDIDPGPDAHSVSDNTQSNWNGIIGEMKLEIHPKVSISNVKIIPNIDKKEIEAEFSILNTGSTTKAQLKLVAVSTDKSLSVQELNSEYNLENGVNKINVHYPMGENPLLWDEFQPNLYKLKAVLSTDKSKDEYEDTFGMRNISTRGMHITINNKPVFFRGTLECCIFPKTGFPPTDEAEWERIINTCKSYGLNHIRFHSWCPPKAAFEVADRLGFYYQVECGGWSHNLGNGLPIDKFIMDESERIVQEYGNHPSFCLFLYGNEPGGNYQEYLVKFVNHWKAKDKRFLLTAGAGWPAVPESDYLCLPEPRIQGWGEGIKSLINSTTPGSDYDWSDRISKNQPTISHEIGQWCVYPDLKERSKYTGVLKAKNFDIFEDRLKENGLLPLADSFLMASGKLQVLCYKADIEAALRTKNFGGFQLLDLHDFPGQGTALVGVTDPFWNTKPYVTPKEYNQFCGSIVPLARIKHFILNSGQTLDAKIEVAQFSASDIKDSKVRWRIVEKDGKEEKIGEFNNISLPAGELSNVGTISYQINTDIPKQLKLEVTVENRTNSWDIWVYPNKEQSIKDILIVNKLEKESIAFLEKGGKVLLSPRFGALKNEGKDSVVVGFSSIFWNTLWTRKQAPHTLGILCNPNHQALQLFPTEYHSNYQWQYAMSHCQAIPLKKLGDNIEPIVRIIDDWFTARSFGMIVELKVGEGKLIICSADLNGNAPEAKQLKNSLLCYMQSDTFIPVQTSSVEKIQNLFKNLQ